MSTKTHNLVSHFARTNFRNEGMLFGLKQHDRLSHMYIVGKTGSGKSTLLETLAAQDIRAGRGFALVDPHGDLVERLVKSVPGDRRDSVLYLNVPDSNQPYGYNPLRHVRPDKIALAASGLLDVLKKMWSEAWGVRMEHILRNALFALLERRNSNLMDILRLFSDKSFRLETANSLTNEAVRKFWLVEYEQYSRGYRSDGIAPIQNKIGAFLADPKLRRILTNPEHELRIRKIMDEGRVLLVNLAKGQIGEDSASLLGGLLVTTIGLAAYSRADALDKPRPFFLYLDEFQSFTTLSLAHMTAELRKYGIGLVLAHQHLNQLEPDIRHSVLGNAGTVVSFRVGADDAPFFAREFQPEFGVKDLLNLPNHHIYLKLMIDGAPSRPFSAVTIPPSELP